MEKRLEALGYRDLQLEQDVVVVRAKDEFDQAVVLLVNPDTLLISKFMTPMRSRAQLVAAPPGR